VGLGGVGLGGIGLGPGLEPSQRVIQFIVPSLFITRQEFCGLDCGQGCPVNGHLCGLPSGPIAQGLHLVLALEKRPLKSSSVHIGILSAQQFCPSQTVIHFPSGARQVFSFVAAGQGSPVIGHI
jgi:hypothetical protein